MASYRHYDDPYANYHYPTAPAPPPPEEFHVAPPPSSAFSPLSPTGGEFFPSPSAYVVSASPAPSIGPSRSSSRARGLSHIEYHHRERERSYLEPGGYNKGLSRSNSERGRDRGQLVVESGGRRGHSRARSDKLYYEPQRTKKYYIDDDEYSNYSGSSYGGGDSRGHSRSHSRRRHSRTPSGASGDSFDDRYAVAVTTRDTHRKEGGYVNPQQEELAKQLKAVQKQLEQVQVDAERKRMMDREAKMREQQEREIEKKVKEQMEEQKRKEAEKARKEKEALEAEKRRIEQAAQELLERQAAAAEKKKREEEEEKAKIQRILEADRQQYREAQAGKKTYTRFSKAHLCKEALEERNIPFSEEAEYFLVHRFVEKTEQQYLWNRTKEIRAYYKQIQEAADRAPTVPGPNGGYVKYVQIVGQPYPMALPVTITPTPGGGQTTKVDKIKWSDIFRGK